MRPNLPAALSVLFCAGVAGFAGCKTQDQHGQKTQRNDTLKGKYFYLSFARAVSNTIQPDLWARAGVAEADGEGTLTFLTNVGTPLTTLQRTYLVNRQGQIDNTSNHPGATLPGGELFEIGDLDRTTGRIGLDFFSKLGARLTLDTFVEPGTLSGFYHATLLRFNRPGILTGTGNATVTKQSSDTASWRIDYTLSTSTTVSRQGALKLAPDGAISVQDTTTGRTYAGFGEAHGDWILWMELDSRSGQVFRLDILVRKARPGQGLGTASLDGRYNLVGFYQTAAGSEVDTLFGRMQFDGKGRYFDFTRRNSFGRAYTTGNFAYPYDVASDGRVTFNGNPKLLGFISRSAGRRLLVLPDVDPRGNPGSVGFFIALRK